MWMMNGLMNEIVDIEVCIFELSFWIFIFILFVVIFLLFLFENVLVIIVISIDKKL